MAKYSYALAAIEDIDRLLVYTKTRWGDAQASTYFDGLEKQAKLLAEMPSLGKHYEPYKEKGVRVFPYEKHLIYYVESKNGIIIVHITHGNQEQFRQPFDWNE